jgi:enoyl-[acyl-carrier-protein] reductase (NADH)
MAEAAKLMAGKRGIVFGVANNRSIAWGIAKACAREGARLALTYQGERLKENVDELSKDLKDPILYPCDVAKDEDIAALAASAAPTSHVPALTPVRDGLETRYATPTRCLQCIARSIGVHRK